MPLSVVMAENDEVEHPDGYRSPTQGVMDSRKRGNHEISSCASIMRFGLPWKAESHTF